MDRFLTTKEAAELLGVAERSVYYYLRDKDKNEFPEPKRFGRTLMWEAGPLTAWREEHPARAKRSGGDQA